MRRAHIVITVGIILLVVTACSGKRNDLRHYGEQPSETVTETKNAIVTKISGTPTTTVASLRLLDGMLSDAAANDIGFHPNQPAHNVILATLATCQAPLTKPTSPQEGQEVGWVGASTSTTLTEYLARYAGVSATAVLASARQALNCAIDTRDDRAYQVVSWSLAALNGVDDQFAWCEHTSTQQAECTVLFAKGSVLAMLQVATTPETKAKSLLAELAPQAANALVSAKP